MKFYTMRGFRFLSWKLLCFESWMVVVPNVFVQSEFSWCFFVWIPFLTSSDDAFGQLSTLYLALIVRFVSWNAMRQISMVPLVATAPELAKRSQEVSLLRHLHVLLLTLFLSAILTLKNFCNSLWSFFHEQKTHYRFHVYVFLSGYEFRYINH